MKKTILLAAVAALPGTQTTTLYAKFEDDDKGAVYANQATKTEIQKPALPASLYAESNEGTQDDWTTTLTKVCAQHPYLTSFATFIAVDSMAIGFYTTITASIAAYNIATSYANQCVTEKTFSDRSWEALSHHPILAGLSAYNFLSLTPLAATPIPLIAGIATWATL